jgi:hypothetical protein
MSYQDDKELLNKISKYLSSTNDYYDIADLTSSRESNLTPDQRSELLKLLPENTNLDRKESAARATSSKKMKELESYLDNIGVPKDEKSAILTLRKDNPIVNKVRSSVPQRLPDRTGFPNRDAYEEALAESHQKIYERLKDKLGKSGGKKLLLPAISGAAGLAASGLAEAFDAEDVGEGSDKLLSDSQERDVELIRDISKDDDTLTQTRLRALQKMLGK